MKTKIVEILIVVVVLLALAALVGCKDEAEATDIIEFTFGDANDVRLEYDEPNYYHPFDPRAYTCPECYEGASGDLCPGHYEPNEPEFEGIDFDWEPDYPIDLKIFGRTSDGVTFKLGCDHEIVCDATIEKWIRVLYESMSGKEPTGVVTLRFKEDD